MQLPGGQDGNLNSGLGTLGSVFREDTKQCLASFWASLILTPHGLVRGLLDLPLCPPPGLTWPWKDGFFFFYSTHRPLRLCLPGASTKRPALVSPIQMDQCLTHSSPVCHPLADPSANPLSRYDSTTSPPCSSSKPGLDSAPTPPWKCLSRLARRHFPRPPASSQSSSLPLSPSLFLPHVPPTVGAPRGLSHIWSSLCTVSGPPVTPKPGL